APLPSPRGIVLNFANASLIGGAGEGNRIVASVAGIDVVGSTGCDVQGNTIGWPVGSTPTGDGIRVHTSPTQVRIGSDAPGASNTITNNGGAGVRVDSENATIRNNSIFANGGLGIDLDGDGVTPNDAGDGDGGGNQRLNFPVLTSVTSSQVEGVLDTAPATYTVEIYVSAARDPSGYGEGQTRVAQASVAPGPFSIAIPPVPIGSFLTANTIDAAGNTSEFSLAQVNGPPISATELVADPVPGGIALRWRDPQASETGFRIEWLQAPSWMTLTSVGPDVTAFTDTTVPPGASRSYRVIATTATGDTPPSNMATATAFSTFALQACRGRDSAQRERASSPSVAWNGTNAVIAWADQRNGEESDIFFRMLDATGAPSGAPVQITNDDVPSTHPTLVWNGTSYGLLWLDHLRAAGGTPVAQLSFAVLGPTGAKVREVRVTSANNGAAPDPEQAPVLVWDGSGWGIFVAEAITNGVADVVFYRLDANGNVIANAVAITGTTGAEDSISAAWNGTVYGVAWAERSSGFNFVHRFARVLTSGALAGPIRTIGGQGYPIAAGTSIAADGSGWAVAQTDVYNGLNRIELVRLDSIGNILSGPELLSDVATDSLSIETWPKLFLKPGGGYVVFASASFYQSFAQEIGRLEADANGQRVGTRITISPEDVFPSAMPGAAFDGTSFVVAWNETRLGSAEIAAAVVSAGGVAGTIHDVTTGHAGPLASSWPGVVPFQNGFVSVWNESLGSGNAIHARIHRSNGTVVNRFPLNGGNPARRVAMLPHDNELAVVWIDRVSGGVHFDRFDSNGNSLLGGGVRIADAMVMRGAAFDFSGEEWGVVWVGVSEQL
ncbi:MAG TPA: hypothetical protein VF057_02745, partial [Thermoanaerobaculia bacterium]